MEPVRVLVVDRSSAMRRIVRSALARDPRVVVVATAGSSEEALTHVGRTAVELVALDVDLPHPKGLDPVAELRKGCGAPVLLLTDASQRSALATLDALGRGAADYVPKPTGDDPDAVARFADELVQRVLALTRRGFRSQPPLNGTPLPATPFPVARRAGSALERPTLLVIGASTGGPDAVTTVLKALPSPLPVPVAIVQHMPAGFTRLFAERLAVACRRPVVEAVHGARLAPGVIVVAPGDVHLQVARQDGELVARLDRGPQVNSVRPSVDVLLSSAAEVCGGGTLAVVLTGIGRDGCDGAARIAACRGVVIAQDEATSVVWGMPGSIARAGFADAVLPLERIAGAVIARLTTGVAS
jgi:two-component system chemotaxis response regulator CheB